MRPGDPIPLRAANYDEADSLPGGFLPPKGVQSARLVLRHILRRGQTRFLAPTMISQENRDLLSDRTKYLIDFAKENYMVRTWIAGSVEVWQDYTDYLEKGVEFFKARMFLPITHEEVSQSVTEYMCDYSADLINDLERVNDLLVLARIMLWKSLPGQQFVFQCGTDVELLRLLEICLRVSARSNDSDPANGGVEQLCTSIVNACKQLLVTILLLFNAFIDNNSGRTLSLWLDLFAREKPEHLGTSAYNEDLVWGPGCRLGFAYGAKDLGGDAIPSKLPLPLPYEVNRMIVALKIAQKTELTMNMTGFSEHFKTIEETTAPVNAEIEKLQNEYNEKDDQDFANSLGYTPVQSPPFAKGFPPGITEVLKGNISRCPRIPEPLSVDLRQRTLKHAKRFVVEDLQMNVPDLDDSGEQDEDDQDQADPADSPANEQLSVTALSSNGRDRSPRPREIALTQDHGDFGGKSTGNPLSNSSSNSARDVASLSSSLNDPRIAPESPRAATETGSLDAGTDENENDDGLYEGDEDSDDEEIEDDERDPYGEAFKSRGIVSELPLVLGPSEIQALPLILKTGVRSTSTRVTATLVDRILRACQCHLLVMQDTGRHLLREMLIFIAAWDLNDEEPVYKAMLEVMESVLDHGLMPIAWRSFRESKDVVSPAQSILVKTLTHIFRLRRKTDSARPVPALHVSLDALPEDFTFEKAIIETLLDDFRSTIVPQTVALIWLQGQIRKNMCVAEDFPLNLWDMERVYEGVYQFLELFAVLTETQCWKEMLIKHQLSFELISLLRELEESIPKGAPEPVAVHSEDVGFAASPTAPSLNPAQPAEIAQILDPADASGTPGAVPVSVERPYDPRPPSATTHDDMPPPHAASPPLQVSPGQETIEEAQEASEFEWRNLKKLVVLVLSSLAYKSTLVKTQVRELGGVELVMKCFEYDQHNPYLREHAVLCLNFLLEKCPENHAVAMEADAGVAAGAA